MNFIRRNEHREEEFNEEEFKREFAPWKIWLMRIFIVVLCIATLITLIPLGYI